MIYSAFIIAGVASDNGQPAFTMFELTKLGIIYAISIRIACRIRRWPPKAHTNINNVEPGRWKLVTSASTT